MALLSGRAHCLGFMDSDGFGTFRFAAAGLMISRAAIVRQNTHQTTCVAPVTFPVSRPLVLSSRKYRNGGSIRLS